MSRTRRILTVLAAIALFALAVRYNPFAAYWTP